MRFWRDIVNDRLSGGALCVLLMLAFVFQAAVSGRAAAAELAPDHATVICSSSGEGAHRPSDPAPGHDCPCRELCQAGAHMPVALAPAGGAGIPFRFADRVEVAPASPAPARLRLLFRPHPARAPPFTSIQA
ncbi:DUF2946 family protein [Mangrovicella endophytica]|uniref:DUF2946 family protein n=1 Tax=Mangrovicella endophytica TaxID=2066697 RepID=UPI000C9E370D|nr:DUF2946 family protein [Mangrovicella endophytica]